MDEFNDEGFSINIYEPKSFFQFKHVYLRYIIDDSSNVTAPRVIVVIDRYKEIYIRSHLRKVAFMGYRSEENYTSRHIADAGFTLDLPYTIFGAVQHYLAKNRISYEQISTIHPNMFEQSLELTRSLI